MTLTAEHRRGHGALYDGLNRGRIDEDRLRTVLAGLPLPQSADGRIVQVPATGSGAKVSFGGAVGHPAPSTALVELPGARGAVLGGAAGGQEHRPGAAAAEELNEASASEVGTPLGGAGWALSVGGCATATRCRSVAIGTPLPSAVR